MLKFFKPYFASVDGAGLYQAAALIMFFGLFVFVSYSVLKGSKKYYDKAGDIPFDEK